MFFALLCNAQDNNYSYWGGLELEKEITKKISLEFEEEFRYYIDQKEVERFMTSFGGSYALKKWLKGGIGYTWIYDHNYKNEYYSNRHRLNAYISAKKKLGDFSFSLREKFQVDYHDESKDDVEYNPHNYLRTKIEIAYNINDFKLEPFISAQFRYQVNNPDGNNIDNTRYALGAEYPFNKKIKLQAYYMYDKEHKVNKPDSNRVFGTNLKIEF